MAKLSFKYGAMNSGKSETLIKTAYNYTERDLPIATMKPSADTKGDNMIVTRAGNKLAVDILATPEMNVRDEVHRFMAAQALAELQCVIVDESQFLAEQQIDQLYEVAKLDDISVITFGLRTDFLSKMFPGSKRLLELADNIEKLPTMCRCGSQGEFNCRQVDGDFVFEGPQVAIDGGGAVTYESLCGTCYLTQKAIQAAV